MLSSRALSNSSTERDRQVTSANRAVHRNQCEQNDLDGQKCGHKTALVIPALGPSLIEGKILKPISIPELVAGIERICLRTQLPDDDVLGLSPEPMKA